MANGNGNGNGTIEWTTIWNIVTLGLVGLVGWLLWQTVEHGIVLGKILEHNVWIDWDRMEHARRIHELEVWQYNVKSKLP